MTLGLPRRRDGFLSAPNSLLSPLTPRCFSNMAQAGQWGGDGGESQEHWQGGHSGAVARVGVQLGDDTQALPHRPRPQHNLHPPLHPAE